MRLTRRTVYALLCALILFAVLFAASGTVFATSFYTTNTSTSVGTPAGNAIELSQRAYPGGATAAVVANADDWTRAAGASVLARAYDGPLLLTGASSLAVGVSAELQRLRPTVVFAVGLTSSTASSIQAALSGLYPSPQVIALSGSDAYETAVLVARQVKAKLGSVSKVVVVPIDYSGGILAGSAMAAANGWPILLTPRSGPFPQVSANAISELGATSGIMVGTTVTPSVSGFSVEEIITGTVVAGDPDGRFSLCASTAAYAVAQGYSDCTELGITDGYDRPGGLVVSTYVARDRGLLLLSASTGLSWFTQQFMRGHGREVSEVSIVGVSWATVRQVKSLNAARVYSVDPGSGPVSGGTEVVVTGVDLDTASSVIMGKNVVDPADWRADSSTRLTITATPEAYGLGPAEVIVQNYWNRSPATVADVYKYGGGVSGLPGDKVVEEALKQLGVKYVWAGATPSGGFDCSGLVMYVYGRLGISLPHYSRAQAGYGVPVSKYELLPGDLVFFSNPISHVGIYVGGGLMINAPRSGDLVTIENVYRSSFNTARRLIYPYSDHQQNHPDITYSGTFWGGYSPLYSGGSFRYFNQPGTALSVKFQGQYLAWVAKKSPVYGKALVKLDDQEPVMVDLYDPATRYQQQVYETGLLPAGEHILTIYWTGEKNPASSDTYVNVDAFKMLGTLAKAPVPGPGLLTYQQTDPLITYLGAWYTGWNSSASSGSFTYSDAEDAAALVSFKGTSVTWIGKKSPVYGKAWLKLDDQEPVVVDLYSETEVYQQTLWSQDGLVDGPHTLVIRCLHEKDDAAGGYYINLDAFAISGMPGMLTSIDQHQQNHPDITYSGTFWGGYSPLYSGGSFRYFNQPGTALSVKFQGQYLAWVAKKSPVYGKALVKLDDQEPVMVDLYDPATRYQQQVYETGLLPAGEHILTIYWTGEKNPASSDTYVNVDAFKMLGTLAKAPVPGPGLLTYQQTDPLITYLGAWYTGWNSSASSGSFTYSDAEDAAALVSFKGTSVTWIGKKSPVYGKAWLKLDDQEPVVVDLYSETEVYQQTLWSQDGLVDGPHTLVIRCLHEKDDAAGGYYINLDALRIDGLLTLGAGLFTRFEEGAEEIALSGAWSPTGGAALASGGAAICANTPGASATIRFSGMYVAWIAKKSSAYGRVKVFLDGNETATVDLYSANPVYQQRVWESGMLPYGDHTLTIQWTWGRNVSALYDYVSLDAFEIIGGIEQATPTVKTPDPKVVVVDPGHQAHANYGLEPVGPGSSTMKAKVSAGTASVNTGAPESALNLTLGLKLRDVLQAYGLQVTMTREVQDVDISNAQRAQLANAAGGDLFVRIHADGSTNPSVNGVLVLYPASISGWTDEIAADSLNSATLALQELTKATGARSRGLSSRSDIAGFNWSDVPVFLAEVGLMTNPAEDALLATSAYQDKIVSGLAKSILCYLDFY